MKTKFCSSITIGISVWLLFCIQYSYSDYVYRTEWFETKVDHFNFVSNATFKMRYLINDTWWSPHANAPIFFYTGNEGLITDFAQNTGFQWEIAPEFKALVIFAEHRFYGESMPFGNKSSEHMGFLSSSQALMDYVDLIFYLKKSRFESLPVDSNPVILFGGSYGGMLAAWMRMKYPGTVAGALASSAPIWQFTGMTPCNAWNRVLTSSFKLTSPKCVQNIRRSWKAINNMTKTDAGKTWLTNTWKLCLPIKTSQNISDFKNFLIDVYGNLGMVNYPYATNFLAPLPAYPVKAFCSYLDKKLEGENLLNALFKAVSVYTNYTGTTNCTDYSDAYASSSIDDDTWNYQSCSEMVMPMCTNGKYDMFEPAPWNLTDYASSCLDTYKVEPQAYLVQNLYGGKQLEAISNIIFSNGLLDPWSSGGVLRNVSATALAIILPDAAHHLDLRASNPADPTSVTLARQYYLFAISQWIADWNTSF